MTLEELTQTLRMAAVNENTITAMTNAYNLGLEAGQAKQEQGELVADRFELYHHIVLNLAEAGCKLSEQQKMVLCNLEAVITPQQRKPLTDEDYVNACMSYRHDFCLMTQEQRDKLLFTAKEWARAFGMNEAAHGIKEAA
jgi:hypothetical protein